MSIKKITMFARECLRYFVAIDGSLRAAGLAYATLISIVPLMVLSFGFVLAFPSLSYYFESLHRLIFAHLIPSSTNTILEYVEQFAANATNLSASGIAFFIITSVLLIFAMENVFNSIWQVQKRRRGIRAFFFYAAILLLIPPIGVVTVVLSVFLYSLPFLSTLLDIAALIVPFLLTFAGYLFIYMAVPNCRVRLNEAWVGALVAALLFEITKLIFRIYVANFSVDYIVYGVLSVVPVLLLWLYIAWIITIMGAIVAFKVGCRRRALF